MSRVFTTCFFLLITTTIFGQDTYHLWLQNYLKSNFGLPDVQDWVVANTESAVIASTTNYGGSTTAFTPTGTQFTMGTLRTVSQGANPWDAGFQIKTKTKITQGNQYLMAVWIRTRDKAGSFNFFAENATTYEKEVNAQIKTTTDWQLYLLPFKSSKNYEAGAIYLGLHLAELTQSIEIGGANILGYKTATPFNQLPTVLNTPLYDGAAENAPWRIQAAQDIVQNRKADLKITVKGNPGDVFGVKVDMVQHDFKFGTAVVSNRFNQGSTNIYEETFTNLDGKGHGFNEIVFENDLKWPAWEQHWFSPQAAIINDIDWLKNKGISVRGHTLMWPGWQYSPTDINANITPAQLKSRILAHIKSILSAQSVGNRCDDWDVINEIVVNNDYANKLKGSPGYTTGREFYAEIFKLADSLAPNAVLYLNDYIALEQADNNNNGIATWKQYIDEILALGGPIEGIGLQGHFSSSPTGIPRAKALLDEFWNKYQLPMKVTEYDISNLLKPEIQAKYLHDMLTLCFAHPGMKGFTMWGFWDGAHWMDNAPLYKTDWTKKPGADVFVDLVFNQWWTKEAFSISGNGTETISAFKGKHLIEITAPNGNKITKEINATEDMEIEIDALSTSFQQQKLEDLKVWPNPTSSILNVQIPSNFRGNTKLEIYGVEGKLVKSVQSTESGMEAIDVRDLHSGMYHLLLMDADAKRAYSKIVIE